MTNKIETIRRGIARDLKELDVEQNRVVGATIVAILPGAMLAVGFGGALSSLFMTFGVGPLLSLVLATHLIAVVALGVAMASIKVHDFITGETR